MDRFRGGYLTKIISIVLAQAFLLCNLALAVPERIVIPKNIGTARESREGKNEKLIIHIQDAHCNYEAQTNISRLLKDLSENYGVNLVSLEGADGDVSTEWFRAFPDAEARREAADYFVQKGELTGAEFFSITEDPSVKLVGAEDRELYFENLKAFNSVYPAREETEKYLLNLKSLLFKLKKHIYTRKLKDFDGKAERFKSGEGSLSDYAKLLRARIKEHNLNLRNYPNFAKLIYTLDYEGKINFDTVNRERASLIDKLSGTLAKGKIRELVGKSVSFKEGKISQAEYHRYLVEIASPPPSVADRNDKIMEDYPNLANFVIYAGLYEEIENTKLFEELDGIKNAVKNKLFENAGQRTLSLLWDNINILLGLVRMELMNKEYDYYKTHRDEFTPEFFTKFINSKIRAFNLACDVTPPRSVKKILPKFAKFYELGLKRDEALVRNTIEAMKKNKADTACLITGGFHTKGIKRILEDKGIAYIVVCPNITKDVDSPYIKVLTNQGLVPDKAFTGSAAPIRMEGKFAPFLASELVGKTQEELEELDERCGNPEPGFAGRTRALVDELQEELRKLRETPGPDPSGTQKPSPGGAVTVDGRPLTEEQKAEVDEAVREIMDDDEARESNLVDTIPGLYGVEIYRIPGLELLPYLVGHPGRGGEARSHEERRIYMSPSRVKWLETLKPGARKQFLEHEIYHLKHPEASEEEAQREASIDEVLAEIAIEEARSAVKEELDIEITAEPLAALTEAAYGIAAYLEDNFQRDKIKLEVYTGTLPKCVRNIADWLVNPGITTTTKVGLRKAITDRRWEDISSSYDTLVAFGTAGIRTIFARGDDLELIANAADEGRGLEIPILRGPNTINPEVVKKFTLTMLKWKAEKLGAATPEERKKIRVGIARDCRIAGGEFVGLMRKICLAFGVTLYIADEPMPLPEFSCAFNEHKIDFGLYVSASHNGKIFNGLKVIGPGGMQMGADPDERKEVLAQFRGTSPREAQLYIEKYPQTNVSADQVVIMGGTERISPDEVRDVTDSDYDKYKLVDTHTNHAEAVMRKVDVSLTRQYGPGLNVGYCAFYGVGRKATPRMLGELGVTNFDIIARMNKLDGRFPGLRVPDPGLAAGWKEALQIYEEDNTRDGLLEKDFWIASDPDADRFGLVIRVSADEIPEDDEVARAMGIAIKLTDEEQQRYGYAGLRVIPANEWGSLITSYDLRKMAENQGGEIQNPGNLLVAFSHVTSDLVSAIAESYMVNSETLSVGVDRLAMCIAEREKEGINVVSGVEESGTYTTGDHIRDKDGFLAGMRIAEIACAALQGEDKKTLNGLLDELYLLYGLHATTNNFMEFSNNVPERTRRVNVMRWFKDVLFEEVRNRAEAGNPVEVAGLKIYGADMQEEFKTGKYDAFTFEGFPDAGIRFYLDEDKKTHITVRPAGTEPKIRFYVQVYDGDVKGKSREFLAERKKAAYAKALQLTKEFMTIANTADMEVIDMLRRVDEVKKLEGGVTIAKAGESTIEALGMVGNRQIARITFRSTDDIFTGGHLNKLTGGKPYRLLVTKRSLIEDPAYGTLLVQEGDKKAELEDKYGDSTVITEEEHNLRMIQAPTPEPHNLVAYIEYESSEHEAIVVEGVRAMQANEARLAEVQAGERPPVVLHMPNFLYPGDSLRGARRALRARTGDAVYLWTYGTQVDSLQGLKDRALDGKYTHVFVMTKEDLERAAKDPVLASELNNVLGQRILPIEKPAKKSMDDQGKAVEECLAFRQEKVAAAMALGLTNLDEVEGEQLEGQALALQRLMCALTGQSITPSELRFLFGKPEDVMNSRTIHLRIQQLIERLLIPVRSVTGEMLDSIRTYRAVQQAV